MLHHQSAAPEICWASCAKFHECLVTILNMVTGKVANHMGFFCKKIINKFKINHFDINSSQLCYLHTRVCLIARNVTGWPANRQAKIFMKIELNSIKNRLSTSFAASGDRDSACFPMQDYGARRSDRWWKRAEGKQVVVVVGEGREKI